MERRGSRNNSSVNLNDIGGSNNRDSYQQQQTLSRPVSSLGGNRASSALSSYGSTVPKTPRTRNGGLAESEIQKIEQSIKILTRVKSNRTGKEREVTHAPEPYRGSKGPTIPTGSFLNQKSFSRSPLNSRVAPISPHRVTMAQSTSRRQIEDSFEGEPGPELSIDEEEEEEEIRESISRKREGLDKEPLAGLSTELQEALIVEDLLFVLMGIEGNYFEYDPSYSPEDPYSQLQGARFLIDPDAHCYRDVIEEVLPLATNYTAVNAFVEQYSMLEHGVINHALCAAIRELLRDYLLVLAQLEHLFLTDPSFNRQVLLVNLRPYINQLKLIHSLTADLIYLSIAHDDEDSSSDNSSDEDSDGPGIAGMKEAVAGLKAAENGLSLVKQGGVAKGGEVLYVISQKLEQTRGDPVAKALYEALLITSSQPYVAILLAWISTGHLDDPWEEFIVREQKGIDTGSLEMDYTDEYWEKRYTLRDKSGSRKGRMTEPPRVRGLAGGAVLPTFLEPFKNKILLAGKYLNVIRECGIEIKVSEGERGRQNENMVALNDEQFFKRIEDAYTYANKTLLKLLLEEQHLVSRLRSIKQYFFMDHGDSFTHFLDIAKGELNKKKKNTSPTKLQALLDLALKNPAAASSSDPFNEDIKVALGDQGLTDWLIRINNIDGEFKASSAEEEVDKSILAYEVFTLDYHVKFPLSLVISRRTIVRYQCIFRHLLQLKRLERILSETWAEHVKAPIWKTKSKFPEVERWKFRMFALRARMYAFIQQMYDFAVNGVLELNWRALELKLEKVETVDQLVKDHADFLDTCMKGCLLTNEKLLVIHSKLLTCCTIFVSYTSSFAKTIALTATVEKLSDLEQPFSRHWDTLVKFETNFNHHNQTNLERINFYASGENNALLPLVIRLTSLEVKALQIK